MAEQGSFGAFSSVPTTQGLGHGSAQVFTPQAIQLDTTALQRGASAIGQANADKKAAKQKAALAEQERLKRLQEVGSGKFAIVNEVRGGNVDEYYKRTVEGGENPETVVNELIREGKNLNETENLIGTFVKEAYANPDKKYYDDEGKYMTAAEVTEFLSKDLKDVPEAKAAQENGTFNQYLQKKLVDLEQRSLTQDPEFSLAGSMLTEFGKFSSLPNVAKSSDTALALNRLKEGVDLQTVTEEYPDLGKAFMTHLMDRTDIGGKWLQNYAIENGMSPYTIKQGGDEIIALAMDAMLEEAANVKLPSPSQSKRLSLRDQPRETEGAETPPVKYEVTYEGGNEGELQGSNIQKQPSLILGDYKIMGKNVSGLTYKDGKQVAIVTSKDEDDNIVTSFDASNSLVAGYKNVTRDKASGGEKGSIVSAQGEFDKSKPKEVDVTKEIETLTKVLDKYKRKGIFGASFRPYSGDNEEAVMKELDAMGYDTEVIVDALGDTNFTNENEVKTFVKTLIDSQPNVAVRRVEGQSSTKGNEQEETLSVAEQMRRAAQQTK